MSKVAGQRVVVLGGTSGIGFAVAQLAAQAGAELVVVSSNSARVEAALALLPGASGRVVDLRDEDAIRDAFGAIGAFDHLVYTAGDSLLSGRLTDLSLNAARAYFDVRYWGAVAAVKHGAPLIRAGGSITLTSGTSGIRPKAGRSMGASICAAMEGMTRALALELAPIRVNCVTPGLTRTSLFDGMAENDREAMFDREGALLPLGRVAEATEIAETYLFLMSQVSATGQRFVVDGGGVLA